MGILIPLADRVWVLPGGVNIGVLANDDGQIVLVDTGLNESSAKKALKAVRAELGSEVVAVLTTHAHADHFGGNATIVKRTGAVVHAPKFDEAFLRYPLLQPASLFGGADPLDTLRGNFLLADASPVDGIVEPGQHEIAGIRLEAVALYGHSPGQLGYLAGDVFFCADVVLPATVLDKYRIPYLFSLTEHLAALERARCTQHRVAVAGHGPILEAGQLDVAIDLNAALAWRVTEAILELTATPRSAEAILEGILRRFDAPVTDAPSFYLLQPTVFAFLSHLHRSG
ncbi:MAG: MBL fold metallo-hydrolase, partial [Aldersonia sp.]|nr:MBL fold metallo-hydrolase [Aldersonia sp.]